jgi:hypothetical protein
MFFCSGKVKLKRVVLVLAPNYFDSFKTLVRKELVIAKISLTKNVVLHINLQLYEEIKIFFLIKL